MNSYRFSRFGPVGEMTFRTMRFSFVVFLGAALSLATGFLLLYLPLTRNVLTFLTIALAVATIALWFPAPVELLLQPAVLGLVLAVACAMINNAVRREKRVPVLTLSSPSDYGPRIASAASASSVEPLGAGLSESGSMGAGSEDPTSLRQATSGERRSSEAREAVAAPESGSQL